MASGQLFWLALNEIFSAWIYDNDNATSVLQITGWFFPFLATSSQLMCFLWSSIVHNNRMCVSLLTPKPPAPPWSSSTTTPPSPRSSQRWEWRWGALWGGSWFLASLSSNRPTPHNVPASSCSRSWKSLGSRGRCRRPVRDEMLAGQMMDLVSEGLAALYTPENKNWEWTVLCVLCPKNPFYFPVYSLQFPSLTVK